MKINVADMISYISLSVSIFTLIHTLRKDIKAINRDKSIVTINTNNEFLKSTVPKIEKYKKKLNKKTKENIKELSVKLQLPEKSIKNNSILYAKMKSKSSTNLNSKNILNELETIAQYSVYNIMNNKIFYNSTYKYIYEFYKENKEIIKITNNEIHTYNHLELLAKKKWIYTLRWGKWKFIKRIYNHRSEQYAKIKTTLHTRRTRRTRKN